jgi:sugar phosphate isomerase/epimerase
MYISAMHSTFSRRGFLKRCAAAGLAISPAAAFAIDPFQHTGPPRLQLSLAAYSFREYFKDSDHAQKADTDPAKRIDLFRFVDYCAEQGCTGAELTCYYFPKQIDEAFLLKLRRHCFLRGVDVSGGAVGNTFTHPPGEKRDEQMRYAKQWVDHYAVLGAPHIRVFAGNAPRGASKDEATKMCIAALEECADYAGKRGIFLGIENHGGIVAEPDDLLDIVRAVKSPWVGINLDSGNFHTDDPYRDFERCAPFAVNVQMKAEIQRRGQKQEQADLPRLVKILRDAKYQGYVALEYESEEDPWKAVPGLLKRMKDLFNT